MASPALVRQDERVHQRAGRRLLLRLGRHRRHRGRALGVRAGPAQPGPGAQPRHHQDQGRQHGDPARLAVPAGCPRLARRRRARGLTGIARPSGTVVTAVGGEGPAARLIHTGRLPVAGTTCARLAAPGLARPGWRYGGEAARRAGVGRMRVAGRAAPGIPVRRRSRMAARRRAGVQAGRRDSVSGGVRPASEDAQGHPGGVDELAAALVAVTGLLGQDPAEYLVDLRRQVGPQDGGHGGRLLDVRPDDRRVQVLLERDPPGQALVQHAAQRVLVGQAQHRGAPDLFRRHVVDRAKELPRGRQPRPRHRVLGNAEVGEVHVVGIGLVGAPFDQQVRDIQLAGVG